MPRAGTCGSLVCAQFGWLVVREVTAHGVSGRFDACFTVNGPDAGHQFSILAAITEVAV